MSAARVRASSLATLALGLAAFLLASSPAVGFSKTGIALDVATQRDVRVFNNFSDPGANANQTPDPSFPGRVGAELALWKAVVEWGSTPHGSGAGDPTQANLGDGGASFDFAWAGAATGPGSATQHVISALSSCGGGLLGFTEQDANGDWRIRFCDDWSWWGGPGPPPGGELDLQGIASHELGHVLGLGHSGVTGATMNPTVGALGGVAARSIEPDDAAGVQCIYGVASATKPLLSGAVVSGGSVTVTGANFAATGNELWFTRLTPSAPGASPLVRLLGLSSSAGGTRLTASLPPDAGPGDVLLRAPGPGSDTLSNAFPLDLAPTLGITGVTPAPLENLVPGTGETILVTGIGFTAGLALELDGRPIAGQHTVLGPTLVRFEWEPLAALGPHTLTVRIGAASASTGVQVVANANPTLQVGDGDPGNQVSGSAPLLVGGAPGLPQLLVASGSGQPSVLPGVVSLGLGNGFSELVLGPLLVPGASGVAAGSVALGALTNQAVFWQTVEVRLPLSANYPLRTSAVQATFTP